MLDYPPGLYERKITNLFPTFFERKNYLFLIFNSISFEINKYFWQLRFLESDDVSADSVRCFE